MLINKLVSTNRQMMTGKPCKTDPLKENKSEIWTRKSDQLDSDISFIYGKNLFRLYVTTALL